jgi:hypothetical protein
VILDTLDAGEVNRMVDVAPGGLCASGPFKTVALTGCQFPMPAIAYFNHLAPHQRCFYGDVLKGDRCATDNSPRTSPNRSSEPTRGASDQFHTTLERDADDWNSCHGSLQVDLIG